MICMIITSRNKKLERLTNAVKVLLQFASFGCRIIAHYLQITDNDKLVALWQ